MVRTRQHQYLDVLSFPDGYNGFFPSPPLVFSCEAADKTVKPVVVWSDFSQIFKLWWFSLSLSFSLFSLYCRYQCCCVSNRTGSLLGWLPIHRVSWECCHLYCLYLFYFFFFFILSFLFSFYKLSTTSRALKRLVLRCNIHKILQVLVWAHSVQNLSTAQVNSTTSVLLLISGSTFL